MHEYLYYVLVPCAQAFRKTLDARKYAFYARQNAKSCRVEFANKEYEKHWQAFCKKHGLKNDASLEY